MKHFNLFLTLTCLTLCAHFAQAQVSLSSTPPTSTAPLDVCGAPATFQVRVQGVGPAAANGGLLTIQMPTGINYTAGSAVYIAGAVGSITEDLSNPSAPVLSIANVAIGNTMVIEFQAQADCRRINQPANSNQFTFTSSAGTQTFAGGTSSNPGYNVQYAAMNITSVTNSAYLGIAGGTFTRTVTVVNGGFGATPEIKLDASNTGGLQIQSVSVAGASSVVSSTTLPSGNVTYTISGFTGNGLFDTNESIQLTETLKLPATACGGTSGASQSSFKAYYGCFGNTICPETNSTDISSSAVAAVSWTGATAGGTATLSLSAPQATTPVCFSNAIPYSLTVTNTSSVDAINAVFTFDSRDVNTQYLSNFRVNGNPFVATATTPPNAGVSACFSSYPAGAIAVGTITIPTILAGEIMTITFDGQLCCNSNYCRAVSAPLYGFSARATFSDACNHTGSVSNRLYAVPATAESSLLLNYFQLKSFAIGLDVGDTKDYCVDLDFLLPKGDNTAFMEFRLPMIPGVLIYTGGPVRMTQDALTWTPAVGYPQVINDTLVTRFNLADMPAGFSVDTRQKHNICIPITATNDINGPFFSTNLKLGVKYTPSTTCSNCTLKLYCGSNEIGQYVEKFGHLPCGGRFKTRYSRIERFSYGRADNNNDNIPDLTGSINRDTIRKYDIIFGDTIASDIKLAIQDTAAASVAGWQYGYVYTTFEQGLLNMNPQMLNATFKVTTLTGQTYTANSVPTTVIDEPASNRRKFGFRLHQVLPAGYIFRNGDTITFNIRYRMDGQGSLGLIKMYHQLYITNDTTVASNIGGDCAGTGSFLYVHPIKTVAAATVVRDPSPCATTGYVKATVSTNILGDFGADLFDAEVRKTAYETTWSVGMPAGLTIDSVRVRFTGSYNKYVSPWLPITPTSVTAAAANFNLKPFYKDFGGTIESWEDRNTAEVRVFYRGASPACVNGATAQKLITNREYLNPIKAFLPTERLETNYTFNSAATGGTGFYMISNDDLASVGDTVTWLVRIANTSSGVLNNVWIAPKSGISGVNIASIRYVNCGTTIATGGSIPIDAKGYYKLGDVSSSGVCLAVKGTFSSCIKDSLTLISGFSCTGYPASIQNLNLLCGIAEQKVYVRPAPTQLQQKITAQPAVSIDLCEVVRYQIAVNSAQKGSVNNIQTTLEILPGMGLNVKTGTSQVEYPHNSGIWRTIPDPVLVGNDYQWNISQAPALASSIGAHGLYGIDSAGVSKNRFNLRFDITTTPCNFRSGIVFIFKTQGKRACGEIIRATDQVTLPVNINGAPTTINNYAVAMTTSASNPCNNIGSSLHFKAINQGPSVSTSNEFIEFVIFNGGAIGNLVNIRNAATLSAPVISSPPGGTVYTYRMPAGITIGDSLVFDATLALNTNALICGVNKVRIDASTTVRFSATCVSTAQTCTLQQTTGSAADYVTINRPKVRIETLVATATLNPPTGETLVAKAIIKNIGTENIAASTPFTLKFYHDADLSGSVTPGDLLLGTQTVAANIAPNATYTVTFIKDVDAGKACPILAIIDQTPCYCDVPAVATTDVTLTPMTFETTTCQGITSIPLGAAPVSSYDYQWVALTPGGLQWLSSTTIANPTFTKFLGRSEDFEYIVYVNRGASSCMGEVRVTVHLASETDCPNYEGSIGNYVWIDDNGNGQQDENGSFGLNYVSVELWASSNSIVGDADDSYLEGQQTKDNNVTGRRGFYLFEHLNSGNYYVKFAKTPLTTAGFTTQNATAFTDLNSDADPATGFSPLVTINIQAGGNLKDNLTIDAGYNPESSVGDFVWTDANMNGKFEPTETGIQNVEVRLYRADVAAPNGRTFLKSTPTDNDGKYLIGGLSPGDYFVEFVKPVGYTPTVQITNTVNGSDPDSLGFTQKFSLARKQQLLDIDAGFFITTLPVKLISFEGRTIGCTIGLTWKTASELNNKEFAILRSDNGATNWQEIGRMKGMGTTNIEHTYSFADKKPRRNNYYKLVQYDFDGTNEAYNLTRNIETTGCYETLDNGITAVYPNPNSSEYLNFKFYTENGNEDVAIEISNTLGQCVHSEKMQVANGANIVTLNILKLGAGTYTIRVVGKGWYSETQKFIRMQ